MNTSKIRTAVLLSGSGRTLENFLAVIKNGDLPIEIVGVVSSCAGVRGLEIARDAGLPALVARRRDHGGIGALNRAQNDWLYPLRPELILLAGYLCFYVRPTWYNGPILNIHPALLPAHGGKGMYGDRVHAAVLAAGDAESGCTVHHVSSRYDEGSIVAQRRVPVFPDDDVHSLAARVFAAECELYPRVVKEIAEELLADRSG